MSSNDMNFLMIDKGFRNQEKAESHAVFGRDKHALLEKQ